MSTPKTTQQLARELANMSDLSLELRELRGQNLPRTQEWNLTVSYGRKGVAIPHKMQEMVMEFIQSGIDKEAASIKKALQEALANE